ncbi:hypothetical protein [Flammeovirga agarivorans]|uniref:Uncharacterized protein n=1 Tax=Flammeovirga agarivorans TaxID=2726742 RepID=A0A7X8SNX6_9BACT|nr:hypothetical protein [Flammeovirga agarivorans]NLR93711.1 hypothetical protein [Flammeovirga agarivorans]
MQTIKYSIIETEDTVQLMNQVHSDTLVQAFPKSFIPAISLALDFISNSIDDRVIKDKELDDRLINFICQLDSSNMRQLDTNTMQSYWIAS